MQGIIDFVIGYLIILVIWTIFTVILYWFSLLFKKNFTTIALAINMLISWGIQIYLFGYAIYILWQIVTAHEWLLLVLALVFGGFILGFWGMVYDWLLTPFTMVTAYFTATAEDKIEKHKNKLHESKEHHSSHDSEGTVLEGEVLNENKRFCSECGAAVSKEASFCKSCGSKI
jgi:hypothetical protein